MTAADTFDVPDPTLPEVERQRLDALTAVLAGHLPDDAPAECAETLARAALAHIDTCDKPGRDELAAAWTRGWLFSYGQDHGLRDAEAHALTVPDHLTDDLPVWNPYDPTEAEPDPLDDLEPSTDPADAPVMTVQWPPGIFTWPPGEAPILLASNDAEPSEPGPDATRIQVTVPASPRHRIASIQYRLDGETVRSVLGGVGGEHACRASYGLTRCLLPKDHVDYDEVLIDGTLYSDARDWHHAGPTIHWPVTGKAVQ